MNWDSELAFRFFGLVVVCAPLILLSFLGVFGLFGRKLSERAISRSIQTAVITGLIASLAILFMMLFTGRRHIPIQVANWVEIQHYHFSIKFEFDRLSVPFVILSYVLCGTIAAFASRYMHREPGFGRFFVLYSFFLAGMIVTSVAGTIETLFAGWELVGLSSALLVAFFQDRVLPVRNGLRVWSVYRIADASLLFASVVLHHLKGEGDFDQFLGDLPWPENVTLLTGDQALLVGSLLLFAAAGKSALVPFSGWLPRAMEGPTPSSAVFYGALSVHLGAFLLLRTSPLLAKSPTLAAMVFTLGLVTAIFATIAGRVQSDIKSALSFASLTQVGIIVMEIGLGYFSEWFYYMALMHILGHACLRTLQFLRAPTLLHDYRLMENALGRRITHRTVSGKRLFSERVRDWFYRFALERGYLDAWLFEYLVRPILRVFQACDYLERRWTNFLAGETSRVKQHQHVSGSSMEDVL